MSVGVLLLMGLGIILLYVMSTIFETPLKILFKIAVNGVLGALTLIGLNFMGTVLSFSIAVNPLSALTVGFLGIPGLVMILALRLIVI